ncbi:MAG: aminopeptidase [Pirellulales bacterium]|nr:aminopeptidase [Pirellulales bacterium]
MSDPRIHRLADILLDHSCRIQSGEAILIEAFDLPEPELVCALIEGAAQRGATPVVSWKSNAVLRSLFLTASEESMQLAATTESHRMRLVQAYIGIRGSENSSEFVDVPHEKMDLYQKLWSQPVHLKIRVKNTKWVVLRYPNHAFAQMANMSTPAFKDFYFDVCTSDYAAMAEAQKPLVARMEAADRVRIVAPGTDIEFSIKGIPVVGCAGENNVPDGEVFTAPVRDSLNGTIRFNTPSRYQGVVFEQIELTFRNGRIVQATANETNRINAILDSDDGARFCGEWAIGCNNRIRHAIMDTLFDEKIGGSFHLTPGQAYKDADNGNRSCIHWDLVSIQRPDYGGGAIYFDGELIRKDGQFVPVDLCSLNDGL